ncbi:MAG: Hsp20/alpha crystallin family protein [Actinomycetota bacterium]
MALPVQRRSELQTWNPFRELDDLHERMARLLETSLGDVRANALTGWAPAVDIEETDEAFVVEAELPGVKREDVTVELRQNELTIHGEVKERERKGVLRRQTRRTGQFDYRVVLPSEVDADHVEASLSEGVLRVQVRKAQQATPRRIEITAS